MTTKPARNGFIDALRAIALIRVVIWHATGNPKVSWVITTMPLMFFVAGALLIGSLERRPAPLVLKRRLKRLLVPFWFFGALVLSACAIVDLRTGTESTTLSFGQLWSWILPLANPTASAWEAGWASSPLWYLRAYLWILLISPALVWAWRKAPAALLSAAVLLMLGAQFVATTSQAGPGALIWIVGDLGIYTFFVLLGFAHYQGKFDDLSRRDLTEWLCVAVVATIIAWKFTGSADGVVNHSYPALLTFGVAWLCAAMLVRPWLGKAPEVPVVGPILFWMTRRAMSIYLWHSPAIVGAYWLLNKAGFVAHPVPVIAITAVLVVVASTATGWIEDVAGGRSAEFFPLPEGTKLFSARTGETGSGSRGQLLAGAGIGITLTLVAASVLAQPSTAAARAELGSESSLALPPAPSGRPDPNAAITQSDNSLGLPPAPSGRPDPNAAVATSAAPTENPAAAAESPATAVESPASDYVDDWRVANDVAGVRVAIAGPGAALSFASGTTADGQPLDMSTPAAATSITKTMTAAIALQLVDEGLLTLDEPIPALAAVPQLAAQGPLTLRQLLNHSSGLVPYQQAVGYDPAASLTPQQAVALSATSPLEWAPGSQAGYSNSGFLTVGLLIEQVTGNSFADELAKRVLTPNSMTSTFLDSTPSRGWVGGAAGGIVTTPDDLLRWGNALYRDGAVLSPAMAAEMFAIDADLMAGLGTFPVCPCGAPVDGNVAPLSYGHNGGSVSMQYAPASDTLIVATFTESFWTADLGQQDVYSLLAALRSTVG